jgi:hypothetical protein
VVLREMMRAGKEEKGERNDMGMETCDMKRRKVKFSW